MSIVATSGLGVLTSYATGTVIKQETGKSPIVYQADIVKNMGIWEKNNESWKFKMKDGTYLTNSWIESMEKSGAFYYVDYTGIMLTKTTTPDGYKVGEDGLWIESTTVSQEEIDKIVKSRIESDSQPVESKAIQNVEEYYESQIESQHNNEELQRELKRLMEAVN